MSVLSNVEIRNRIGRPNYKDKLIVTPLLSEKQIGTASIDIRLGSSIIVPKKTYVESHDMTRRKSVRQVERKLYDRVRLRYHSKFILHPDELILGVTFEYICLPHDTFCSVTSRSSWGRLGLVVATASIVQPGFKGSLTLELANLSNSPVTLYPGLLVGQLVFYDIAGLRLGDPVYKGRYDCPTEAGRPQFYTQAIDDEMSYWGQEERS
ncbi:MAG TPA: dCTP deaminase [Verrucomicrobiae bacterium]|nr:dCTP deaminase [Verrucomicrobiae bacterium]